MFSLVPRYLKHEEDWWLFGTGDEEQRVDRWVVSSSGTVVVASNELGFFVQGIFMRGSQLEVHRVLRCVVVPREVRPRLLATDRKQCDGIPSPKQLVHPEFEDPSSSNTEIRGTFEEIVEGERFTNLIFHEVVPDYLEYGSRGDPLLTQFARGWRGFCDHEEVGGLVTFWRSEGVSQALE